VGDLELYRSFQLVERLHVNFYNEVLDPEDFNPCLQKAIRLIKIRKAPQR